MPFARFVPLASAEALARVRILTAAILLSSVLTERLPALAVLPEQLRRRVGLSGYFPPLNAEGYLLLESLTIIALVLVIIGYRARLACALAALLYVFYGGYLRQFGGYFHQMLMPMYLLGVLALTPCGDALTWKSWRSRPKSTPSLLYGWGLYLCWTMLAMGYFAAGLSKLRKGGLLWWDGWNLKGTLLEASTRPGLLDIDLTALLVDVPVVVFSVAALVTLAGELGYVSVLFSRRARLVFPLVMTGVHVGILLLQNILFLDLLLLQLIVFDWGAAGRWLKRRRVWRAAPRGPSHAPAGS